MFIHDTYKRVRYGETDRMGYLYYGNYPLYYEIGRVEAMRSLGLSYKVMEEELKVFMPVMSLEIRYLRPAFYDNEIRIRTEIKKMPERDIVFHNELFNEADERINAGKVRLCFLNPAGERVNCPDFLMEKLGEYFG
jgi:acyl-CoA thioester hydrolase